MTRNLKSRSLQICVAAALKQIGSGCACRLLVMGHSGGGGILPPVWELKSEAMELEGYYHEGHEEHEDHPNNIR